MLIDPVEIANIKPHYTTEKSVQIASLSVEVSPQSCDVRTRIIAQAALSRALDRDLARIVLDFLFQVS